MVKPDVMPNSESIELQEEERRIKLEMAKAEAEIKAGAAAMLKAETHLAEEAMETTHPGIQRKPANNHAVRGASAGGHGSARSRLARFGLASRHAAVKVHRE